MRIFSLTKTFLLILVRDKSTVFWLMVFPLVLLAILVMVFSSFDNPENLNFKVVLLRNPGKNVQIIEKALKNVSDSEKNIISLELKKPAGKNAVLKKELEKLKESKIHALVVIPEEFNSQFERWMQSSITGVAVRPPEIKIYFLEERAASKMSTDIVKSLVKNINNRLAVSAKLPIKEYKIEQEYLGTTRRMRYSEYIFPSIIIFSFLATSLFGIAQEVVEFRSKGILKRLHLTTISSLELFISFNASRIALMTVQFLLISVCALWIFKINVNPFSPAVLSYSTLSATTFMSLAFMLASVISNTQQATVVVNLVLQVFQFLGGLYFDVFNIPLFLRWIAYINPITYLVSGLREDLGIVNAPYPYYLSYTVPLIWVMVSAIIAGRYFRWVEEK